MNEPPIQPNETERVVTSWYVRLTITKGLINWHYQYWFRNEAGEWIDYPVRDRGRGDWYIDRAVDKLLTLPEPEQQTLTMQQVGPLASAIRQRYQRSGVYPNSGVGGGKTLKGVMAWAEGVFKKYGP
ncbi:hypothetical protein FAES_3291 [Fibrella aestuarina BUZ 2]|uniref:Uncharacterized protein n=1 Tax=Fibrella aestuarina BUZ 2 TaxID=1166018 RepID=I0KAZ6_9BACT|nr:hypothetical protein [Fibrella aestuarina]CCH01299.1 hypothetical protein FAES_3291 [Fibrella aestuarina BUZ 2]